MIEIHMITKKLGQVKEILELLIINELIIGATVVDSTSSYLCNKNKIKSVPSKMIIGRTRAGLFSTIEKLLQAKYGDDIPMIYGMPIVGMGKKNTEKLKKIIEKP